MYVIRPTDRDAFKRCRRQWDFGSPERQGRAPATPPAPSLGEAIRSALAVYYYPGMWEWDRAMVRALARDAYLRSFREQGGGAEEQVAAGARLLDRYFDWVACTDDFVPVRVGAPLDVPIPHPRNRGREVTTPAGDPVRFQAGVDLLAVDDAERYWVVEHRLVEGPWPDPDLHLLDDRASALCWAWEADFLGMRIAGLVVNEIRGDGAAGDAHDGFRRTHVPRSAEQLEAVAEQLGIEALEMVAGEVAVYPNPTPENCAPCPYREPCTERTLNPGGRPGR